MPPIVTAVPSGSPPTTQAIQLRDWTGGLNLRDDAFQLQKNETPDCLDVDISAQGGFARRGTVRAYSDEVGTDPDIELQLLAQLGQQLVVGGTALDGDDHLYFFSAGPTSSGTAPIEKDFATPAPGGTGRPWSSALAARITGDMNEKLYVHRDDFQPTATWDGATLLELGDSFGNYNEDIAAPAGGFAPLARVVCAHLGYLFHAYTSESGDPFPGRVRWSHPGEPQDYRENDFFDVEMADSTNGITALASFAGNLFIFKRHSTWILTGFDADTFALHKIADVGAVAPQSVASSTYGLVAFDSHLGVHALTQHGANGWSAVPLWNKLNAALVDGRLSTLFIQQAPPALCWFGSRLFVSGLRWGPNTPTSNRTFVFDPYAGKGAWYAYSVGGNLLCHYQYQDDAPTAYVAGVAGVWDRVHAFAASTTTDNYDGITETSFDAYLYTGWLDAGDPALKKRWRRFSMTFDAQNAATAMFVRAWKNWSTKGQARVYQLAGTSAAGGMVWGDPWGDPWSASLEGDENTVRGGTIGTAYAVAVKVSGPVNKPWGCNALVFRFIPQRIV